MKINELQKSIKVIIKKIVLIIPKIIIAISMGLASSFGKILITTDKKDNKTITAKK